MCLFELRYISDEDKMYKTFDAWDKLQAPMDLDNGSVGRNAVADACILRATADLGAKIRRRYLEYQKQNQENPSM